jgi:hypothetical protein
MMNLEQMSRVLHGHQWDTPDEWVNALDQLATITDHEIMKLVTGDIAEILAPSIYICTRD